MFNLRDIPDSFLRRIEQCSEFFKSHQCQVIMNNISTFNMRENFYKDSAISILKQTIGIKYLENCKLNKIRRFVECGVEKLAGEVAQGLHLAIDRRAVGVDVEDVHKDADFQRVAL